jgi:YihY family inner membrane protein
MVPLVLLVLVGLTLLVHVPGGGGTLDPAALFHRFLPQHDVTPGLDPLEPIERLLASILRNRESVSLVAGPTFLWFSSRLFASMRNSLSFVYDTQAEPAARRGIIRTFLHNKSRDLAVALVVVVLLLANTLLSAGIALVRARGATLAPPWSLFLGELGRFLTLGLELVFSVSLFYVLYRFAATRRLSYQALLVGAVFSALGFELAKRLFGLYVARTMITTSQWTGAQYGAVIVFVLWVYYMGIVFLLGGVVAERVEARRLQRRQRALLA